MRTQSEPRLSICLFPIGKYADFYIQGVVAVTGTVTLNATNALFATASRNVEIVQGVMQILNLSASMSAASADDPFQVRTGYMIGTSFRYAPVSGAGALHAIIASSNGGVGLLRTAVAHLGAVIVDIAANTYDSPATVGTGGFLIPLRRAVQSYRLQPQGLQPTADPSLRSQLRRSFLHCGP